MNEIQIEKVTGVKNLRQITRNYFLKYRKHRHDLTIQPNGRSNRMFLREDKATEVIMNCRTGNAYKFRTTLEFNQHDIIMNKEQSVLTKIMKVFSCDNIEKQYSHAITYKNNVEC